MQVMKEFPHLFCGEERVSQKMLYCGVQAFEGFHDRGFGRAREEGLRRTGFEAAQDIVVGVRIKQVRESEIRPSEWIEDSGKGPIGGEVHARPGPNRLGKLGFERAIVSIEAARIILPQLQTPELDKSIRPTVARQSGDQPREFRQAWLTNSRRSPRCDDVGSGAAPPFPRQQLSPQ